MRARGEGAKSRKKAAAAPLRRPVKPRRHGGDDLRRRELGPVGRVQNQLTVEDILLSGGQSRVFRRLCQFLRRAHKGADPVQEGQEVAQVLGRAVIQLLRRTGQFPALTGREPRQHLARHGGLQVDMELHLGHPAEKNSQVFHLIRSFLPHLFRCGRPLPRPCPFIVPRRLPCLNHFSEKPLPFCKIHVIILL